ncbi:MAG: DUF1800 domain-containing protein [Vicinamibacterales bacterium]
MLTRFLTVAATFWLAALGSPLTATAPTIPASDQAILHVLNRLTFGPRPGEVARVKSEGLAAWIERQLNPSRIADQGMSERLARLSTLGLDSETIARDIHQPARRERQRLLQERSPDQGNPDQPPLKLRRSAEASAKAEGLPPPQDPRGEPPSQMNRGGDPSGSPATTRRPMNEIVRRDQQIITDLSEAKILRAIYSDRQLEEVLVDFWFNHFNVFAAKGPTRVWVGEFEREAIRPHVLGKFRTMLEEVAKSPAMLFYLDNWMNVDPSTLRQAQGRLEQRREATRRSSDERASDSLRAGPVGRQRIGVRPTAGQARQPGRGPLARRATGLNENYARELMELHTLGVDGGYTQQDVVNVARAFTGWGMSVPREMSFRFDPRLHDAGEKTVLGHTIKAGGGIDDGRQVLDILVAQPAAAHFIAEKLARRFVSDEPPADLVNRAAAKFSATHGDLRETLRVIITSPEFFAPAAYRAKVKTPLEFVVSAFRATGADVGLALPVVRELRELGMPLYLCQPPTGYDDTASAWVSSGALVNRMNFALALAENRVRGVRVPFDSTDSVVSVRTTLLTNALAGLASNGTLQTIEKATTVEQTVALALGSPEFQKK